VVVVVVVMVKYCLQELLDLKLAALNDWYLSEKISSRTYLLSVYERIVFTWVAYQSVEANYFPDLPNIDLSKHKRPCLVELFKLAAFDIDKLLEIGSFEYKHLLQSEEVLDKSTTFTYNSAITKLRDLNLKLSETLLEQELRSAKQNSDFLPSLNNTERVFIERNEEATAEFRRKVGELLMEHENIFFNRYLIFYYLCGLALETSFAADQLHLGIKQLYSVLLEQSKYAKVIDVYRRLDSAMMGPFGEDRSAAITVGLFFLSSDEGVDC
jgi:hypothetical protein